MTWGIDMRNNENNNEGVSVMTVVFVVLLAAMGLFLLFSSERHGSGVIKNSPSLEAAASITTLHDEHHLP